MASISSSASTSDVIKAIETLSNLLSALSPEEVAALRPFVTPHQALQLKAIADDVEDQVSTVKASFSGHKLVSEFDNQEPSTDGHVEKGTFSKPTNPLKRRSESPTSPPEVKKERSSTNAVPAPAKQEMSSTPSLNPLASLFAERGARLESQQRQRKEVERADSKAKARARQEAIATDPTKAEQRKYAEDMKIKMGKEKAQKELLLKRIEEDKKERNERTEQQRLRREAIAIDGKVPGAKRVQILNGEIKMKEEKAVMADVDFDVEDDENEAGNEEGEDEEDEDEEEEEEENDDMEN